MAIYSFGLSINQLMKPTKPLLDTKKVRLKEWVIFETKKDGLNFLYDILLGIRSHKASKSKNEINSKNITNN